jgi:hypothetical protein
VNHFSRIPHQVSRNASITIEARGLFTLLASYTSQGRSECWPGIPRLLRETNWSDKTLSKYILELMDAGLVTRTERRDDLGHWQGWLYRLHFEKPCDPDLDGGQHGSEDSSGRQKLHTKEDPQKQREQTERVVTLVKRSDRDGSSKPLDEIHQAVTFYVERARSAGTLRSEPAYRATLQRKAAEGTLDLSAWQDSTPGKIHQESSELLNKIEEWKATKVTSEELKDLFAKYRNGKQSGSDSNEQKASQHGSDQESAEDALRDTPTAMFGSDGQARQED